MGELGRVALEDHGHALGVGSAGRHQGAAAVLRLQSGQEGEVPDQAATWLLPVGGVAEQSDPGRPEWMPDRDGPAPEVQSLQRHRAHLFTTVQLADTIQHYRGLQSQLLLAELLALQRGQVGQDLRHSSVVQYSKVRLTWPAKASCSSTTSQSDRESPAAWSTRGMA